MSSAPMDERHIRMLQNGKLIAGQSSARSGIGRAGRYQCNLTPGVYAIVITGSGMSGEASFTVGETKNAIVRIMLR